MSAVITLNAPGARTLRDARPMTFGLGRNVTAHWSVDEGYGVTVFVGLTLVYNGPTPEGVTSYTDREFYAWVCGIATAAEGRECD
jgi:hypothetical protein